MLNVLQGQSDSFLMIVVGNPQNVVISQGDSFLALQNIVVSQGDSFLVLQNVVVSQGTQFSCAAEYCGQSG